MFSTVSFAALFNRLSGTTRFFLRLINIAATESPVITNTDNTRMATASEIFLIIFGMDMSTPTTATGSPALLKTG